MVVAVRSGECNQCGACCKSGDPFNGEKGVGQIPGACPYYVEMNGVGACSDRTEANTYYWNACRKWPDSAGAIVDYPRCSYRFE